MRVLVLVLSILGAVACGLLGWKLKSVIGPEGAGLLAAEGELSAEALYLRLATWALLAAFPLGMAAGIFGFDRKRILAALLLLVSGTAPLVLTGLLASVDAQPLMVSAPAACCLCLAGVLSFRIKRASGQGWKDMFSQTSCWTRRYRSSSRPMAGRADRHGEGRRESR